MRSIKILTIFTFTFILTSCGQPDIDITSSVYNPKITVEGYLYCNESVKDIRLSRNFMLNTKHDLNSLVLTPRQNDVVVTINGVPLNFDAEKNSYYNNNILIECGKTYRLDVNAVIDGKQLHTSSATTTPQKGFSVTNNNLGTIRYHQALPIIEYTTSPGVSYYIFSIMPDYASLENFIYDNPYEPNKDTTDLLKDFNSYRFQCAVIKDINPSGGRSFKYSIEGYNSWFYGSYTVTVYAGDNNFGDFLLSSNNVQEMDGNFHEPIQSFEGDGIGVFGSAIKDTVKFVLVK